ncbi:MAG: hypothetical protein QXX12_00140 [Nanopusillaceae archaeon]
MSAGSEKASDRQISYLRQLIDRRRREYRQMLEAGRHPEVQEARLEVLDMLERMLDTLTREQASKLIDVLLYPMKYARIGSPGAWRFRDFTEEILRILGKW